MGDISADVGLWTRLPEDSVGVPNKSKLKLLFEAKSDLHIVQA